jgi:hypothetical protein
VSRFLSRFLTDPGLFSEKTAVVTNPTRRVSALFETRRKGPQDAEGSEDFGPPGREGRAGVAAAIPDYSITAMSDSTQERSK